ncbi:ATP-binding protein [Geminicoccus harenae]|uniref:AAA family ATPase n=1 Tax=Geminicoccus harenae TaxID=2498453 RepID=UPI00168A74AD|nr:AAA family ATPase [Geminicoccus harenae]
MHSQTGSQRYQSLCDKLAEIGGDDPLEFDKVIGEIDYVEKRLDRVNTARKLIEEIDADIDKCKRSILELRRSLTKRRSEFVGRVLRGNKYVRIDVVPYGDIDGVEGALRSLLNCLGDRFSRDFESLLGGLSQANSPLAMEQEVEALRNRIAAGKAGSAAYGDCADRRFLTMLQGLAGEVIDKLDIWYPEDTVQVLHSPTGNGDNFRAIKEGSPGQKTAALLAFLLPYGDDPIILDQPEDDLDNNLVYRLIVKQIKDMKIRRQVIVVTHNANIVVNGDAEYVVALTSRGGQAHIERQGCLQDAEVRRTICEVMEGGREAFAERYRRIALNVDKLKAIR